MSYGKIKLVIKNYVEKFLSLVSDSERVRSLKEKVSDFERVYEYLSIIEIIFPIKMIDQIYQIYWEMKR